MISMLLAGLGQSPMDWEEDRIIGEDRWCGYSLSFGLHGLKAPTLRKIPGL